jgi:hypothetical protein
MLNDMVIVQSAASAFNNSALAAPAFLWWAVLMLPLYVAVYWYGCDFMTRIGWNRSNLLNKLSLWTVVFVFAWIVLFGGNYAVLRDNLSVLPMLTAVIVFLSSLFIFSHLRQRSLPHMGWKQWLFVLAVLIMVGLSDTHAWWGPLLQISALLVGALFGRFAGGAMRPMGGTVLIMMTVVIAILMQPEFFRFGQLGNLTVFHLLAILLFGIVAVATVVVSNISPGNKIQNNIFIKFKWLWRVACLLGCALFMLTEAVPVLLGTLVAFAVMFTMSVLHAKNINNALGDKLFAVSLFLFGVICVMPVISAMGILYWLNISDCKLWQESKVLL